jgi:hypothetical protein
MDQTIHQAAINAGIHKNVGPHTFLASHFYEIYRMIYAKAFEKELQILQGFYKLQS